MDLPARRAVGIALVLCGAAAIAAIVLGTPQQSQPPASEIGTGQEQVIDSAHARTATLVGDLQTELGCSSDWDPTCGAGRLMEAGVGVYEASLAVPAGTFQVKVAIDGTWGENYGAGGVPDGANIPVSVAGPTQLLFRYDDTSHLLMVRPTDTAPDAVHDADRALASEPQRPPLTRERFYFVMTDRFANGDPSNDAGGLTGDRTVTGLDPSDVGFYHGGDLRGIIERLDYIKRLGTTAIWLTPAFRNRPVQGSGADASAGYHGYWITDFTQIDPHLGTNAQMRELIDAAHAKGMKVFFDIITNHTADIIDNEQGRYHYVPKSEVPYRDAAGNTFDDAEVAGSPGFPELNLQSFPYTPKFRWPQDATAKVPQWLNDPTNYHNRGDSTFTGESSTYGDFSGLDDLFTEKPDVEQGMEDIYQAWIDLGVDGFRIDTVKHVNIGFWQRFAPAMIEHARARGNDDFFMFGEVYDADPTYLSTFTKSGKLQAALDFGFQSQAVAVAQGGSMQGLAGLFDSDDHYTDADSNAYQLPTFLGNHDMGRVGHFLSGSDAKLERDLFAHSLMYTLRGQPVVYYGDEQGFTGYGRDKAARQDMFASQVAQYNADPVLGGPVGSRDRYDAGAPIYTHIAKLAKLRAAHPALADGSQIARYAAQGAGILAVSRIDRDSRSEYLVVANNDTTEHAASFATATPGAVFRPLLGGSDVPADRRGEVTVKVPPLTVWVLRADRPLPRPSNTPPVEFSAPLTGANLAGDVALRVSVATPDPVTVTFAYRSVGARRWSPLGTDDNAPFRVYPDLGDLPAGALVEFRAVVRYTTGQLAVGSTWARVE